MLIKVPVKLPKINLGLVARYTLSDGINVADSSGNGFNATSRTAVTPVGGIALKNSTLQRNALSFNGATGTSQVLLPTITSVTGANPRTVMAWIKPNNVGSVAARAIFYSGSNSNNGLIFGLLINVLAAGDFYFVGRSNDCNSGGGHITLGWQHVAVTYAGGATTNLNGYRNAVLLMTGGGGALNTATSNFTIGFDPDTAGRTFDGAIDDVRIYNRALSPGELLSIYSEAFQPVPDVGDVANTAATAATVAFRRSLSNLGTRAGSRQVQAE